MKKVIATLFALIMVGCVGWDGVEWQESETGAVEDQGPWSLSDVELKWRPGGFEGLEIGMGKEESDFYIQGPPSSDMQGFTDLERVSVDGYSVSAIQVEYDDQDFVKEIRFFVPGNSDALVSAITAIPTITDSSLIQYAGFHYGHVFFDIRIDQEVEQGFWSFRKFDETSDAGIGYLYTVKFLN